MKIAYFSDLMIPYIGGGESYFANLESRIKELGHETIHITSRIENTKSEELVDWKTGDGKVFRLKIKRVPIPFRNNFILGRYFFPLSSLLATNVVRKYDIIHASTFMAGLSGWLIGKLSRKPTLLFCHEMFLELWKVFGENFSQRNIYPLVEKLLTKPYNYFATPSRYSKGQLMRLGVPKEKITVIPHGIDPQFNPHVSGSKLRRELKLESKLVFGFTGRLKLGGTGQSKGLPYLLEAAKLVFDELEDARLVLGGSNFESLLPIIRDLGIKDKVIYAGKRPYSEISKFYAMLDCFVGASLSEGFGLAYAEASRCGKPVVATKAGSIPEIILDKRTGLLVEPRNPEALAKAIIKVLANKNFARKLGRAGVKYTGRFTWEKSAENHLKLYKRMLMETKP